MARYLGVAEAARIDQYTRLVQAGTLVSDLTPSQRKSITDDARAVRLFAEAGCRSLARPSLDRISKAFEDTPHGPSVNRLAERILSQWRLEKSEEAPS